MNATQYKQDVRNYIIENFYYGQDDNSLTDDVSFLENGIIDSTGVLELLSFIQENNGIAVNDDEIIPENFDSLNKISAFIEKKKSIVA